MAIRKTSNESLVNFSSIFGMPINFDLIKTK